MVRPTSPHDQALCEGWQGARLGATPVKLELEGEPRTLHVWARARGPLGIRAGQGDVPASSRDMSSSDCAIAAPGAWARLDLAGVSGVVIVDLADVDLPGQRRGQTSPFVLVVTDDDAEPDDQPDDRNK